MYLHCRSTNHLSPKWGFASLSRKWIKYSWKNCVYSRKRIHRTRWFTNKISDSDSIIYLFSIYRTHTASILKSRSICIHFPKHDIVKIISIKVIMIIVFNHNTTLSFLNTLIIPMTQKVPIGLLFIRCKWNFIKKFPNSFP